MEAANFPDTPITIVSFRISGSELDPDMVSEILNLAPDRAHMKGSYLRNDPKYSPYKQGMWGLSSKLSDEESLSAHLESLLSILVPKQEQILKLSENNAVDFYCSLYSQSGFQISSSLLKRIANLGAAFGVTIYPSETVTEDENSLTD